MNINIRKFLTVFLTLIFSFTVFTGTAFAQADPLQPNNQQMEPLNPFDENQAVKPSDEETTPQNEDLTPDDQSPDDPLPDNQSPDDQSPDDQSTDDQSPDDQSADDQSPDDQSPDDQSADDQSVNSKTDNNPTKSSSSSSNKPIPKKYVDTQRNRVEAAASQAAEVTSDPDVLSSQSWNELLTSEDKNESNIEVVAGTVSNTHTPAGIAGVSWILILGVVLIVLALCGIVLFIYLQFFNKAAKSTSMAQNPMTFEDISSDSKRSLPKKDVSKDNKVFSDISSSSSKKAVPALKSAKLKKSTLTDKDETAPIPGIKRKDLLSKSKAKPVNNRSDFDFEKFFDKDE